MVYPILKINQDDYEVDLCSDESDKILCSIKQTSPSIFSRLLLILRLQYLSGYDDGWTDAEQMLTEEDEYDC